MNKYGQNHDEIVRFIDQIKNMTPEQINAAADAAYDAAYDAANAAAANDAAAAAYDAANDAAYDAYEYRWFFGRAAFALAIKHLIGTKGFTQAHYDLLTAPVRLLESYQIKETKPINEYGFDRANFALNMTDIIDLQTANIINITEARYLIGLNGDDK